MLTKMKNNKNEFSKFFIQIFAKMFDHVNVRILHQNVNVKKKKLKQIFRFHETHIKIEIASN